MKTKHRYPHLFLLFFSMMTTLVPLSAKALENSFINQYIASKFDGATGTAAVLKIDQCKELNFGLTEPYGGNGWQGQKLIFERHFDSAIGEEVCVFPFTFSEQNSSINEKKRNAEAVLENLTAKAFNYRDYWTNPLFKAQVSHKGEPLLVNRKRFDEILQKYFTPWKTIKGLGAGQTDLPMAKIAVSKIKPMVTEFFQDDSVRATSQIPQHQDFLRECVFSFSSTIDGFLLANDGFVRLEPAWNSRSEGWDFIDQFLVPNNKNAYLSCEIKSFSALQGADPAFDFCVQRHGYRSSGQDVTINFPQWEQFKQCLIKFPEI